MIARWLRQTDMVMLSLFLMLIALGAAVMSSISPAMGQRIGVADNFFLFRHLRVIPLAIIIMLAGSFLAPRTIIRWSTMVIFPAVLVLLSLTLFFSDEIKGANRWLSIAGVSLQPSEFIKPLLCVTCGALLGAERSAFRLPGTIIIVVIAGYLATILWLQPDIGQSILILSIVYVQIFVAGNAWRFVALFPFVLVLLLSIAYVLFPHVADRVTDFFFSHGNPGYQMEQVENALIQGGWLGQGLGMGAVKPYLPDAHTDFVMAVISEELGGLVVLMVYFLFLSIGGIAVWRSITSLSFVHQIITAGLLTHLIGQTLINTGAMLQLIPATGMTVPFLSYGGSSMIASATSAGLLLVYSRRGQWTGGNTHA